VKIPSGNKSVCMGVGNVVCGAKRFG
jgi:hypothetical protein